MIKPIKAMRYYNYDMQKMLPKAMNDILQKYFPTSNFGVSLVLDNLAGEIDLVTIDTCVGDVKGETEWTHYANIQRCDKGWELNEQFKGENEKEMWIYGYFKTFGACVRNLATKGTKDRKPIEIYK